MNAIEILPSSIDFTPLHERMQWYVDQNILSCCNTLVMRGLDVLDFKTFGFMDLETRRPLRDDAIFRSIRIPRSSRRCGDDLFEEGRFGLDDPLMNICRSSPRSRAAPRRRSVDDVDHDRLITMRQVLSRSAGFSYGFISRPRWSIVPMRNGINALSSNDTLEAMCDRLATVPLAINPARAGAVAATGVTARVVEVLSGGAGIL
jgi:hypothetical protein